MSSGPPALDSSSLSVLGALHGFLPWQMFEARLVLEASVAALAAEVDRLTELLLTEPQVVVSWPPNGDAPDIVGDLAAIAGDNDPTTRVMLEGILAQEEEHANDMHDLLVAHEGTPFLKP